MVEAREPSDKEGLLGILEADLPRLVPGVGVVDRGLVLSRGPVRGAEGRRADLVLLDDLGRALIVLVVDGRGDDTVLAAIDALAFARRSGDALARPNRELRPREICARVALAAEAFSTRVLEALSLLPERELLLFEPRRTSSEAGPRTRLARVDPMPARTPGTAAGRESFLSAVPDALRTTADRLLRRLTRVDAEIELAFADSSASVRCGDRELAALSLRDGSLHGEIPALDRRLPIRGPDDADLYLDEVLRQHLADLEKDHPEPEIAPRTREEEPLLTPEEIAAFHA
jgi:hypothetical protein